MTTIYLVNIGANMKHRSVARSPIFPDGRFVYVPFPTSREGSCQAYPLNARPFVRDATRRRAHADPDWEGLTYGDCCINPRAISLRKVVPGDILLFWGLLWENDGADWAAFNGSKDWYLLGAIRVAEILRGGEHFSRLPKALRPRAKRNAHLYRRSVVHASDRVFIGDPKRSMRFEFAVPLEIGKRNGLAYRVFTTADGRPLKPNGVPSWEKSLRSCRPMWRLDDPRQRQRAQIVAKAIAERNEFDLLSGLV
jgi:hypothetical protein